MNRDEDIITVQRRSDRSIVRLVDGEKIGDLDIEKTALLISLCQCTGWSAEHICLCFKKSYDIQLKPEDVWSFFWRWIMSREVKKRSDVLDSEIELMVFVMRKAGFEIYGGVGRPLNKTVQPVTVDFCKKWCPKKGDRSLCKGFTQESRAAAKNWFYAQQNPSYDKLAPTEQLIVERFGSTVEHIVKDIMRQWNVDMVKLLNADGHRLRALKEEGHVNLILHYLDVYTELWEDQFGNMEDVTGENNNGTVYIRSTGYGVKVLIGLLMADRLHVIDQVRKAERFRIGFEKVGLEALADDAKTCPICQDEMGIDTPEGVNETPLILYVCCGQAIGEQCLKTWLGSPMYGQLKTTCPCCRFKFPVSFLKKLLGEEYAQIKAMEDAEEDSDWDFDEGQGGSDISEGEDLARFVGPPPVAHAHPPAPYAHQVSPADLARLVFMAPLQSSNQIPALQSAPISQHPHGINPNGGQAAAMLLPSLDDLVDLDDFMMEG